MALDPNSSLAMSVKELTDAMKAYGCAALGVKDFEKASLVKI